MTETIVRCFSSHHPFHESHPQAHSKERGWVDDSGSASLVMQSRDILQRVRIATDPALMQ
eukprot:364339-Chlamydomonas_euryale.AAC.2